MARKRSRKDGSRLQPVDKERRLLKAMRHPLRAQALSILNEHIASPKEIAAELDVPIGTIGYHVKELESLECIELVETVPRRGATEHFYRAVIRSFLDGKGWASLSPEAKQSLSIAGMKTINKIARDALVAGTFDSRDDRHLSRTPYTVDEQGWRELMELLMETLEEAGKIEARSGERVAAAKNVGDPLLATVILLGFESPPPS